jgi:hypothetical protein
MNSTQENEPAKTEQGVGLFPQLQQDLLYQKNLGVFLTKYSKRRGATSPIDIPFE